MARHKDTYRAKLSTDRQPTIESQGRFRFRVEIQSGDAGRPVDLGVTEEELEWALKTLREIRLRQATDQARREQGQRVFDLQRQVWDRDRRINRRDRQIKELKQAIDGAHAVAHKDQAAVTSQADPFAFLERPDATAKLH